MCRLLCGACRATGLRNGCRPGARPASSSTHAWMAAETSEELQQRNGAAEPNLLNQAAKFEVKKIEREVSILNFLHYINLPIEYISNSTLSKMLVLAVDARS